MKRLLATLILVVLVEPAAAETSSPQPGSLAAFFHDEILLRNSKSEIQTMRRHELDLLYKLLATCRVTGDEVKNRLCEIFFERYALTYMQSRRIDRLLFLWFLHIGTVNHDLNRAQLTYANNEARKQQSEIISRIADIKSMLNAAISARIYELEQQNDARG